MTLHDSAPLPFAVLVASAIALAAWRARSLTARGALAALVVGAVALRAAWSWGALLVLWFALASALSRVGRARKHERTRLMVAKGDVRGAGQVLANGGVFALAAGAALLPTFDEPVQRTLSGVASWLSLSAAGALGAAGADTWATEIGTLAGGRPRSVRTWRRVAVGTSGAVTLIGTLGALAGATLIAGLATALGVTPREAFPVLALAGLAGAFTDTLLGAFVQERRHCPRCDLPTEQPVHACGTPTRRAGGIARLDNDVVNLLCTIVGALVAVAGARLLPRP